MTEQVRPTKKSKAELEALVKAHGGKIVQRDAADENLVVVADKRLVKVASLEKRDTNNIVRPVWISDCVAQHERDGAVLSYLLPFEPNRHMLYLLDGKQMEVEENVDGCGDAYARDIEGVGEMRALLEGMDKPETGRGGFDREVFLEQLEDHGEGFVHLKCYMFSNMKVAFEKSGEVGCAVEVQLARNYIRFGGGVVVDGVDEEGVTHIVAPRGAEPKQNKTLGMARVVGVEWIQKCWAEGTRVDEERFQWG